VVCRLFLAASVIAGLARGGPENPSNVPSPSLTSSHTNRLAGEKSPYLLQHQHNPVDWYPWGEAAFQKARAAKKPIFLSIGYSTCHWCHVMERESFENKATAEFLNAHFVSIKVDREERPDVDKIYMTAVQAMSGQGGWPLNCFLTPDLRPFYGGTYFPPEEKYGRASFIQILRKIADLWETRRDQVLKTAADFHEQLEVHMTRQASDLFLSPGLLANAARVFEQEYDRQWGGFGGAPKFPRPSEPLFLLRQAVRAHEPEAIKMVLTTCDRMADGGIHDQLGGGFCRYSVDAKWLVPHFEKMLYDNAQLVNLYLDAYLVSGQPAQAETARDIIRYVLRDMTSPEGGFFSAEDADSEGKEGKFYCWTKAELQKVLTHAEYDVAARYYGVTAEGNFIDHSDPDPLPGQNVLSVVDPHLSPEETSLLHSAKAKLLTARNKRVRPHLDDKVLASWNGMMLGALARAYAVLGDETFRAAAEKNLGFIQAKLWNPASRTLYHRWREGERDTVQLLTAYANLLAGTIDLYEATLEPKHLNFAVSLAETMLAKFYDAGDGGFFDSAAETRDLILRVKEDYDGAEPSGNAVAVLALLRLGAITERKPFKDAAEKTLRLFAARLQDLPQAVPHLLMGLDFLLNEPRRVVVAGNPREAESVALLRAIHGVFQPNKVVLGNRGAVDEFAKTLPAQDGPTAYLCTGTACQPPTRDPVVLQRALGKAE
jgi:uncharacterized protein YyaL (SSP411 family)